MAKKSQSNILNWGKIPAAWQKWAIMLIPIGAIILAGYGLDVFTAPTWQQVVAFLILLLVVVAVDTWFVERRTKK